MKLIINKNILESAINLCSAYVDKKDSSSITSNLLFEARRDELIIKASDYEMGLSYKIKNVKIENEGFATAEAKKISDMIKSLNSGEIILETIDNFLFIKEEKTNTKFKLPMFNYEEFPNFQSVENKKKFNIEASNLRTGLKKILSSIDTNNPKQSLNGALLDIKNEKINFVGTDTRRLAVYELKQENTENFKLCIPKKAILEMIKIFTEKVEIFYDENILISRNENFEFFTKLINDKFPDYERVIPNKFKKEAIYKTDDFLIAIKKINAVAEKLRIIFKPNKIVFESLSVDNIEAKTEINVENNFEAEFELIIKNKYLLDFLSSIEDDNFNLKINDSNLPFLVQSKDLSVIIMPMI